MRLLSQFTAIAFVIGISLIPNVAEAQERLGLEVIAGVTHTSADSEFYQWKIGPGIGFGVTYAVFPAVTNTPTVDVGIRAVYHRIAVSGRSDGFALPRSYEHWTTGDPLQAFEFSSQIELLLGGRAARVSPVISLGGGLTWMIFGEVFLHSEGERHQYVQRALASRRSRYAFISPGVGATGKIYGRQVTAEARATINGDRRLVLIPLNLRVRL
jgi:hypothetical protein